MARVKPNFQIIRKVSVEGSKPPTGHLPESECVPCLFCRCCLTATHSECSLLVARGPDLNGLVITKLDYIMFELKLRSFEVRPFVV